MNFHRKRFAALVCAFAFCLVSPTFAADENDIVSARLLAKKKTAASKKEAADLYLKNAFYERALECLLAAGEPETAARASVVSAAFAAGHRMAALTLAGDGGNLPDAKLENARLVLAEGRTAEALALAKETGDEALIRSAKEALFKTAVYERFQTIPLGDKDYVYGTVSPDGRFFIARKKNDRGIAAVDMRSLAPGAPHVVRPAAPQLDAYAFSLDRDGRFIALVGGKSNPKGKSAYAYRIERLDTGAVAAEGFLPSKMKFGLTVSLLLAGESLYIQTDQTLTLIDPFTGKTAATATLGKNEKIIGFREETKLLVTYDYSSKAVAYYDGLKLKAVEASPEQPKSRTPKIIVHDSMYFFPDEARNELAHVAKAGFQVTVDNFETGATLRTGNPGLPFGEVEQKSKFTADPVNNWATTSPDRTILYVMRGDSLLVSPFPYADREAVALGLASELGRVDELKPLAWKSFDAGAVDEAKRLLLALGEDPKKLAAAQGDYHLNRKEYDKAAEQYAAAGENARIIAIADAVLNAAKSYRIEDEYRRAEALYRTAGVPSEPLALAAARMLEKEWKYAEAVDYYLKAGARNEVERIFLSEKDFLKNEAWCLRIGAKLGLSADEVYAAYSRKYETEKRWEPAAMMHLKRGDAAGVERIVRAAFASSSWHTGLLSLIKDTKDAKLVALTARLLHEQGQAYYAVDLLVSLGDTTEMERIADQAYADGDLFTASTLYGKAGTKNAKAAATARFMTAFEDLRVAIKRAENAFSTGTLDRINSGKLKPTWPIPADKLSDDGYAQLKKFGEDLAGLESKPTAAEAKKGALALGKSAAQELKQGNHGQASFDQKRSGWYTFAASMLTAMGR